MRIPIVAPRRIRVVAAGLALIVASIAPASVLAVSPTNDNLATATVVGAFPFADTADISAATSEPGEPFGCASSGRTVWYTISPAASGSVTASAATSTFEDAMLNVYTASAPFGMGDLTVVACGTYSHNPAVFAVHAGLTYYIQASDYYSGGGTLNITFTFEPPVPNDSFADAVPIGAIPFSDTTTNTAATSEAGEPHCGYGLPWGSVWYKFVPTESGSVTATTSGSWLVFSGSIFTTLGAYQGSSVDALTALACRSGPSILTLEVDAGSTYYFQAAGTSGPGTVTFRLETSPSPIADFYWNPSSPSTFDTVYFNDYSVDPGNAGFQTAHWEFGAGATADGLSASHQFANDGDYTVSMTTTTVRGDRPASARSSACEPTTSGSPS